MNKNYPKAHHPKLALLTGASSGLGKALAYALAQQGVSLILIARRREILEELKQTLTVPVEILIADLSQQNQRKQIIECIHLQVPDLIINCAGFGLYGPVLSHPLFCANEMLEVNAHAVLELTIEAARALKQKGAKGVILNISSAAAFFSYPTFCIYAATKAFVLRFSEAMDAELKKHKIRILTACPGQIDTEFRARASNHFSPEKNSTAMSIKTAVDFILYQIKKEKAVFIFDWKYRWIIRFSKIIPKYFLNWMLEKSLSKRY